MTTVDTLSKINRNYDFLIEDIEDYTLVGKVAKAINKLQREQHLSEQSQSIPRQNISKPGDAKYCKAGQNEARQ